MKSIETTRMELFETWFKGCQQARLNRGFDEYTSWEVTLMTMAFNAALMSHDELIEHLREEIKLVIPERMDYHDYLSLYDKGEAIGHNNAIGQVIRLNPNLTLRVIK